MKLKSFLFAFAVLCACRMPANAFVEGATPSNSATGGLADELFTFDPSLSSIKLEYVDFKIDRGRTVSEWGKISDSITLSFSVAVGTQGN